MDAAGGGYQFSRQRRDARHCDNNCAGSPSSESYSFMFESLEPIDDGQNGKIDGTGPYRADTNAEDTSAIGDMLVSVLNRFTRHCSGAEDQLEKMRRQNAAQSAEMQELRERVKKLEALLPALRVASPPYHERGLRTPPYGRQARPPHQSEAPADAAIIAHGRVVRMRAGERPRELWTACRTEPTPHARSERDGAELEQPYAHSNDVAPAPRLRRPPSPKPPPSRNPRFSPMDAPPIPTRSITSPESSHSRNMLRDGEMDFEPRGDNAHVDTRATKIQPLAI